jgi:glutaredoxin
MPPKKYGKDIYSFTDIDEPSQIDEVGLGSSTLEDIDRALKDYIDDALNIHVETNKGSRKVPVVWVSAERAYQIKHNKNLRSQEGSIILPAITIERTSTMKDLARKGGVFGNIFPHFANSSQGGLNPFGTIAVSRRVNQSTTSKHAASKAKKVSGQENFPVKNRKIVYETAYIPMPQYVELQYDIKIRTEYQQQMNDIVTPFLNFGLGINYHILNRNGHTYEAFLQSDFSPENNVSNLSEEERTYETKATIKVLGYILGQNEQNKTPTVVIKENFVSVKIGKEKIITQANHPEIEGYNYPGFDWNDPDLC